MNRKPLSGLDTHSLVLQRIQERDYREALLICIREFSIDIGEFCMAMLGGVQQEVDETVQEIFVAAYESMSSLGSEDNIRVWLFGIARYFCARRIELHKDYTSTENPENKTEGVSNYLEDIPDKQQLIHWIRKALEYLKPSERDAVMLHFQAGLSYEEIAKICNKEKAVALVQTSRALLRLRTHLKDKVVV